MVLANGKLQGTNELYMSEVFSSQEFWECKMLIPNLKGHTNVGLQLGWVTCKPMALGKGVAPLNLSFHIC